MLGLTLIASYVFLRGWSAARVRAADLPVLALSGLVGLAGTQLAYYTAMQRLPLALAVLLLYLAPVLTLAAAVLRRQAVPPRVAIAVGVVVVGCYLSLGAYDTDLLQVNLVGAAIGLLSAACFAAYLTLAASSVRLYPSPTVTLYNLLFAALFWQVVAPLPSIPWASWDTTTLVLVIAVTVNATIGLFISIFALARLSATRVIMTQTLELLIAGAAAYLFLQETLQPLQIIGAGIVVAGIVLASTVPTSVEGV